MAQEATVDTVLDPLTAEGYEAIRKQVGDEAANQIALDAWKRGRFIRHILHMVVAARGEQVAEIWLEEPEGSE